MAESLRQPSESANEAQPMLPFLLLTLAANSNAPNANTLVQLTNANLQAVLRELTVLVEGRAIVDVQRLLNR